MSAELVIIVEPELTVTLTSFAVTFTAVLGLVKVDSLEIVKVSSLI